MFKKEGSQPYAKQIKDTYLITGYEAVESAAADGDEYDEEDIAAESAAADEDEYDEENVTPEFLTIDPDSDYFFMDSDDIAQENLQRPHDDLYDSLSEEELRENHLARERELAACIDPQSKECRKIEAHRAILTHLYGGPECIEGWTVSSSITHPEFFGHGNCDDDHSYGKVIHGYTYAIYPIVSTGNGSDGYPCSQGDQPSSDHFGDLLSIPGFGYSSSLPIPYRRECVEEFYKTKYDQPYPWRKDDYDDFHNKERYFHQWQYTFHGFKIKGYNGSNDSSDPDVDSCREMPFEAVPEPGPAWRWGRCVARDQARCAAEEDDVGGGTYQKACSNMIQYIKDTMIYMDCLMPQHGERRHEPPLAFPSEEGPGCFNCSGQGCGYLGILNNEGANFVQHIIGIQSDYVVTAGDASRLAALTYLVMQDIEADCNWAKGGEAENCSKNIQELEEILSILESQVTPDGDIGNAKYNRYLGNSGLISHYLKYACGQNPYHEESGNYLNLDQADRKARDPSYVLELP